MAVSLLVLYFENISRQDTKTPRHQGLLAEPVEASMANSQWSMVNGQQPTAILCPMIDARRMEVYTAFFNDKLERISETEALVVDENSFMDLKQNNHLYLFGDGADKLASLFENEANITVVEKFHCSAAYMAKLVDEAFKNKQFVDVAYFEPFYLKNFVPGMPKVKGLN
jgi:tRNA threonylcarbamoyladenosine biosynthesis protein TsaB